MSGQLSWRFRYPSPSWSVFVPRLSGSSLGSQAASRPVPVRVAVIKFTRVAFVWHKGAGIFAVLDAIIIGVSLPDGEYRECVLPGLWTHSKIDLAVRHVRVLITGVADVVLVGVFLVGVGN